MLLFTPIATVIAVILFKKAHYHLMNENLIDEDINFLSYVLSAFTAVVLSAYVLITLGYYQSNHDNMTEQISKQVIIDVDSLYNEAYKNGQIDFQNNKIVWEKYTNDCGDTKYIKIN